MVCRYKHIEEETVTFPVKTKKMFSEFDKKDKTFKRVGKLF